MNKSESWSLIARHLSKTSTPEEEDALATWIAEDKNNQKMLDEAIRVWALTAKSVDFPEIEIKDEWQALLEKIKNSEKGTGNNLRRLYQNISAPIKIAAVFVMGAALYWILRSKEIEVNPPSPKFYSIQATDSVKHYMLPDSSIVWLNSNTELKYDSGFADRKVFLDGEGFFKVKPVRGAKNFSIYAQGANITVVGTEFNVNASDGKQVTVVVVSGHVEMQPADSTRTDKLTLKANDKGVFMPEDSSLSSSKNDDPGFLEWRKHNNNVFEHERMNPKVFLKNSYTSKKNLINETQIEGRITNNASIVSYKKIRLKISSVNRKGKKSTTYLDVASNTPLLPGKSVTYKQTLFDVLSAKTNVVITIEEALGN